MLQKTSITRRNFIASGVSALTVASLSMNPLKSFSHADPIKAIAFDAFPVFDPRPVFEMTSTLFGEKGIELATQWRTTQFEYSWLRTSARRYENFWRLTEDALVYAAKRSSVSLSPAHRKQLMEQYLQLNIWPDVLPALQKLKNRRIRLCFLSNMTNEMITQSLKHSNIEDYFEVVISTDRARTYKPDPKAYQLGTNILKLKKEQILFVAFAGWDACGAKWFGYPTFWMNRMNATAEELNATPDATGAGMMELLSFIG